MKKLLLIGAILTGCGNDSGGSLDRGPAFPAEMQGSWILGEDICTSGITVKLEITGAVIKSTTTEIFLAGANCAKTSEETWIRKLTKQDNSNFDLQTTSMRYKFFEESYVAKANEQKFAGRDDWYMDEEQDITEYSVSKGDMRYVQIRVTGDVLETTKFGSTEEERGTDYVLSFKKLLSGK